MNRTQKEAFILLNDKSLVEKSTATSQEMNAMNNNKHN